MNKNLKTLADFIKHIHGDLKFTFLEVGALQVGGPEEIFYELLDLFPLSKVIGFEIDEAVCVKMNANARTGINYYPNALGEFNEKRKLYVTQDPMCTSLYKPNDSLISLYNNFDVADLKHETEVETISLDYFLGQHDIGPIDFIKIDVQGAELDIFKGAPGALKDVLKIVCEVEFVPHYEDQPLFGDVCSFLNQYDLMFNKFLGLAGRALKPVVFNNNKDYPSQHIWSDAVFIRHVQKMQNLSDVQLLKLSLLACVYGSIDLSVYCLSHFDKKNSSSLSKDWLKKIMS